MNVKPLSPENWNARLCHIVEDMNGQPINIHSLMAHSPELLTAWWNFRNYSVSGGALGKRKSELVILRVAVHLKSWYEWGAHVDRSLACGLALKDIQRVKQKNDSTGWAEDERCLLSAVDQLVDTHAISPDLLLELDLHFTTLQVLVIIAIHGMYLILGCMINTWGLDLDQHIIARLPDSITREQFEKDAPS
jgi:4-carboxymuconolactone decarboxylase